MDHKKTVLRGAFLLTAAGFLSRIMGFFYRIFLSRIIGAEGLGLYQMIFPILALALSVTSAGLSTAISHQVSRKNALGDKRGIWNIFFAGAAFSLLLSFLAAGLLRSYAGVLAEVFLKDVRCEELLKSFRLPSRYRHGLFHRQKKDRSSGSLPAFRAAGPNPLLPADLADLSGKGLCTHAPHRRGRNAGF